MWQTCLVTLPLSYMKATWLLQGLWTVCAGMMTNHRAAWWDNGLTMLVSVSSLFLFTCVSHWCLMYIICVSSFHFLIKFSYVVVYVLFFFWKKKQFLLFVVCLTARSIFHGIWFVLFSLIPVSMMRVWLTSTIQTSYKNRNKYWIFYILNSLEFIWFILVNCPLDH